MVEIPVDQCFGGDRDSTGAFWFLNRYFFSFPDFLLLFGVPVFVFSFVPLLNLISFPLINFSPAIVFTFFYSFPVFTPFYCRVWALLGSLPPQPFLRPPQMY